MGTDAALVTGDRRRHGIDVDSLLSAANSLQHTDSSSSLSLEALADVIGVGSGPVFKQHLPGLTGSGQVLQVLYLIGGPANVFHNTQETSSHTHSGSLATAKARVPSLNAGETQTLTLNPPFPFEGRFGHVGHRDHLLSRSDPHDGAVVALCGALQPQTGERPPGQSPLRRHRNNKQLWNPQTPTGAFVDPPPERESPPTCR